MIPSLIGDNSDDVWQHTHGRNYVCHALGNVKDTRVTNDGQGNGGPLVGVKSDWKETFILRFG